MSIIAAIASALRGEKFVHEDDESREQKANIAVADVLEGEGSDEGSGGGNGEGNGHGHGAGAVLGELAHEAPEPLSAQPTS
jgi:hypothetical protein